MEVVHEKYQAGKFRDVGTPFWEYSTYEKDLMAALYLNVNSLCKLVMEYYGKFGHTIGWI